MNRPLRILCLLSLLCLSAAGPAADIRAFVSIAPQQFIVEQLGAGTVAVEVMLPAGASPELYEPLPKQLAALQSADIYFLIGVPFERAWQAQLRQVATPAGALRVVACCRQFAPDMQDDPHVWTNPLIMLRHARQVKHHLQALNPAQHTAYEANFNRLAAALRALDSFIAGRLEAAAKNAFFVVHPAWGYFAQRYGLRQYALENGHVQASARDLAGLVERARAMDAAVLFSQRQYHSAAAKAFAGQIDAEIISLDPLAADYINNMRHVAEQFARALR